MAEWGFGFSFDMELEKPLDFFDVKYKNGEKVRYDKRPHGEWKTDGTCSKCGVYSSLNKDTAYFCPNCGSDNRKMGEDAPKSQEDNKTKKCPICGSDLYEHCGMCCYEGEKVLKNEQ